MQYQINRTYQTGYTGQKPYFWPFLGSFLHKLWELCIINYICMTCYQSQMLRNILYHPNMQYQVDPTDQIPENGQKPLFWLFGSFKNAILCFLNDPS